MPPIPENEILQDVLPEPQPRTRITPRTLIVILGGILVLIVALRVVLPRFAPAVIPEEPEMLATPTPLPATNTYVDQLFGTLLYFKEGLLREIVLPYRMQKTVVGIAGADAQEIPQFTPVWSYDGKYVALLSPSNEVVVTEYSTGMYVMSAPLVYTGDIPTSITVSFSSGAEMLVVHEAQQNKQSLRFYDMSTKREVGNYPQCTANGGWVTTGYIAICSVDGKQNFSAIQFTQDGSSMVTILQDIVAKGVQFVSEYDATTVLVTRREQEQQSYARMTITGAFQTIPESARKLLPPPAVLVDAQAQFIKRIEEKTGKQGVRSFSSDSSGTWVAFEDPQGIWVVDLLFANDPYFIGPGTSPSIRP